MRYPSLSLLAGIHFLAVQLAHAGVVLGPNTVDLGYSTYQGSINPNSQNAEFLGLRYAASPSGTNRWCQPQAPPKTYGVQQANTQPNRCFQAGLGGQPSSPFRTSTTNGRRGLAPGGDSLLARQAPPVQPPTSEDCLFLNVYSPGSNFAQTAIKKLPVVVWFHGGGYAAGSASGFPGGPIFDGNDLIREAGGGVVAVIVQYRLGVFGFLAGSKVKLGGALNAGLLDQQFALKWVQQHISKFGGDPTKVTLWGESAGAGSALQHLLANGGNTQPPLFRAAISSSLYLPSQYQFNDNIPEAIYSDAVTQTGCASSRDTLACLRRASVDTLQNANANISNSMFFGTIAFAPVVDGSFIKQRPSEALKLGRINAKGLLTVTNTFEGLMFVDPSTASTVQVPDYVAQLFPLFGETEIANAVAQYQGLGSNFDQVVAIMGESIIICPTYALLRSVNGQAFKGEFAIPPGSHSDDAAYYFPSMNPNGQPPFTNPDFDKAFPDAFLDFALSLDPNTKHDPSSITPKWAKWDKSGLTEMLFNRTGDAPDIRAVTTSAALLKRCDFWASVAALTGQ